MSLNRVITLLRKTLETDNIHLHVFEGETDIIEERIYQTLQTVRILEAVQELRLSEEQVIERLKNNYGHGGVDVDTRPISSR